MISMKTNKNEYEDTDMKKMDIKINKLNENGLAEHIRIVLNVCMCVVCAIELQCCKVRRKVEIVEYWIPGVFNKSKCTRPEQICRRKFTAMNSPIKTFIIRPINATCLIPYSIVCTVQCTLYS